jgi:chromosome segregation ATPase
MKSHPRTKPLIALLAVGVLALGAVALSVDAKPDGGRDGPAQSQAAKEHRQEAQDRAEAMREKAKQKCSEPANDTAAKRCEKVKDLMGGAAKARREAHALLTAIRVHERQLGNVDFRIHEVEQKLASGNLTANQTSELQNRLGHLKDRHDRLIEKIAAEKAKLQALHDKWAEVRDHLRDRKEKGEDDGGVEDSDSETTQTSTSTSTSGSA